MAPRAYWKPIEQKRREPARVISWKRCGAGSFWSAKRRVRETDPSALCLPALLAPFRACPIYGEILELGAGLYFVA